VIQELVAARKRGAADCTRIRSVSRFALSATDGSDHLRIHEAWLLASGETLYDEITGLTMLAPVMSLQRVSRHEGYAARAIRGTHHHVVRSCEELVAVRAPDLLPGVSGTIQPHPIIEQRIQCPGERSDVPSVRPSRSLGVSPVVDHAVPV
jgi:hypothetical protein